MVNRNYKNKIEEITLAQNIDNLIPIMNDNVVASFAFNDINSEMKTFMIINKYKNMDKKDVADMISITDPNWNEEIEFNKILGIEDLGESKFEVGSLFHIVKTNEGKFNITPSYYNKSLKQRYQNVLDYANLYLSLVDIATYKNELIEVNAGLLNASLALSNVCDEMYFINADTANEVKKCIRKLKNDVRTQTYEDAYNIAPNHEIASLLGQIYMELGQYNEAFILFNLVKLNFPTNLSVLMNLAKCKFLQGDKEQAKKYVQKVLDILPEHEEAQQMLEEINK